MENQVGVLVLHVLMGSGGAFIMVRLAAHFAGETRGSFPGSVMVMGLLCGVFAHFVSPWLAPASLGLMSAVMLAGLSGRWARRYGGFWPPVAVLALIIIFGVKFG